MASSLASGLLAQHITTFVTCLSWISPIMSPNSRDTVHCPGHCSPANHFAEPLLAIGRTIWAGHDPR